MAPRLDGDAAAQAAILGATPAPLQRPHHRLEPGTTHQGGVVVDLDGRPRPPLRRRFAGPRTSGRRRSRCSPAPSTARPSYLDVSVPDRPVSGG